MKHVNNSEVHTYPVIPNVTTRRSSNEHDDISLSSCFQNHQENFEMLSFWLSNTYHLLNCLKQYSGEEVSVIAVISPLRNIVRKLKSYSLIGRGL